MKKIILSFFGYLCLSGSSFGQVDSSALTAGWGNMDFAVPQSPAFKILATNPDNILQPSSAKTVALSIGNYFATNGPLIPKSLAVEFSPLLFNSKLTLREYNRNKFWNRLRLSFGTSGQQNATYSVAEGLRLTIIDKTDLRANGALNNFFAAYLHDNAMAFKKTAIDYAADTANHVSVNDVYGKAGTDSAFKQKLESLSAKYLSDDDVDPKALSKFRDSIKNTLWNKTTLDIGIAALQSSKDSLISNLGASAYGIWISWGLYTGKHSQLLLGVRAALVDSISWHKTGSIGAKFYYGKNNVKVYAQAEFDFKESGNTGSCSIGCDFNIANGIWGQFGLNVLVLPGGKLSYQPGFNFGLGTPEKKNKN